MKTHRNYRVITTFAAEQPNAGMFPDSSFERVSMDDWSVLPVHGVPCAARDTLLARLARSEIPAGLANSYPHAIRRIRTARKRPAAQRKKSVFDREPLLGRLIGVEIEYYPRLEPSENALTSVHGDGSLGYGGREINRITWQAPDGRLHGLLALRIDGRVNRTCGLHVHVDVRHLETETLHRYNAQQTYDRLTQLYKFLKKLVPRSRRSNSFCRWVHNGANTPPEGVRQGSGRYAAINALSIREHGTLEFRCQGGTTDKVKIESWALLCQWLVGYCSWKSHVVPGSWREFLAVLPEPLRSWCYLRFEKLYGAGNLTINERTLSAISAS